MTTLLVLGSLLLIAAMMATVRGIRSDGYRRLPVCDSAATRRDG
jgi:hypothetical protein